MKNKMKKAISFFLVIAIFITSNSAFVYAEDNDDDGEDTDNITDIVDKIINNEDKLDDLADDLDDASEDVNCGEDTEEYIDKFNNYKMTKEHTTIKIKNIEEFELFAKNCTSDWYSINLTVELNANINLDNSEIATVPVFNGVFNGNGHTIAGIRASSISSNFGLFRIVGQGAIIRDLNVSADIDAPEKTRNVAVIAGINSGLIKNCKSLGSVISDTNTGGIVGQNRESGSIVSCMNMAIIFSNSGNGGICGSNFGSIISCKNYGGVNISANESSENTAGIAGRNKGSVEKCENKANIGYEHTGYNIGGIVGINSGVIISCDNHGIINGRKDVGGIVGQFEPSIELEDGHNPVTDLDNSLDSMVNNASALNDELNNISNDSLDSIQIITDKADNIKNTTHDATGVESDNYNAYIDSMNIYTKSISDSVDILNEQFTIFNDEFIKDMTIIDNKLLYLRGDVENVYYYTDANKKEAISDIDFATSVIDNSGEKIESDLQIIAGVLETYEVELSKIATILSGDETNAVKVAKVVEEVTSAINTEDINAVSTAVFDITQQLSYMKDALTDLQNQLSSLSNKQSDDMDRQVNKIDDDMNSIDKASDGIRYAWTKFSAIAENQVQNINDNIRLSEDLTHDYTKLVSNNISDNSDSISSDMDVINDEIDDLNSSLGNSSDDVHEILKNMSYNFDNMRSSITDILSPPKNEIKDISDMLEYEGNAGRVVLCSNYNEVHGDSNAGGISGIMAKEMGSDPEEDSSIFESTDSILAVDTTAIVKATLRGCSNYGQIFVKTGYAGGIVGRNDVGAVLDCLNAANIDCEDAKYVGGIAGISTSLIMMCYSISDLTADSYIGGIAGSADDLKNCLSMTRILSGAEKIGAIAGYVSGECSDNYFVDEGVAGVDETNYIFKAEPITYEDMIARDGAPDEFKKFNVVFKIDGKISKILELSYKDEIDDDLIPQIPEKEGYYARWSNIETTVFRDQEVNAEYNKFITSISSNEGIADVILEGEFNDKCTLSALSKTSEQLKTELPSGYEFISAYELSCEKGGIPLLEKDVILIHADKAETIKNVFVLKSNGEIMTPEIVGSYIKLTGDNNDTYALIEKIDYMHIYMMYILKIFAAVLAVLILLKFFKGLKIRRKNKKENNKKEKIEKKEKKISIKRAIQEVKDDVADGNKKADKE